GAATPPWTPFCSTGSAPSERSPCQGDPQLVPLRCAPGGCYSPLDPLLLHRVRSFGAFPCQGDPQLVPLRCAPGGCYSPLDPPDPGSGGAQRRDPHRHPRPGLLTDGGPVRAAPTGQRSGEAPGHTAG